MTTKTRLVTLTDLALAASTVPGERDTAAAIDGLVGEVALFRTFEGEERIGLVEAPSRFTGGGAYPVVRFADGMWARLDEEIHLVTEGGEDLDAVDREISAHEAVCDVCDPEECGSCDVLWTRRANANV